MAKTFTGLVSSDKGDKTIVVTVQERKTHPIYKKQYTVSRKFMAHDEGNEAKAGDKVLISETRPVSARKRFKLDQVIEKAAIQHAEITDETVAEVTGQLKAEKEAKVVTVETAKAHKSVDAKSAIKAAKKVTEDESINSEESAE